MDLSVPVLERFWLLLALPSQPPVSFTNLRQMQKALKCQDYSSLHQAFLTALGRMS